ncbi:MAG: hypothetical protein ABSE95_19185 [Thermodesulfobacteriota bacterium]|jgi:hypothetical protein
MKDESHKGIEPDIKQVNSVNLNLNEPITGQGIDYHGQDIPIENLPISERVKSLVLHGNDGTYQSRSEVEMAVVAGLINKGVSETLIQKILEIYPVGEKYREHNDKGLELELSSLLFWP